MAEDPCHRDDLPRASSRRAIPDSIERVSSPSLNGRTFKMLSSTASAVDPKDPSIFHYHERDGIIWGDYTGDTVSFGRFVGTRTGDEIAVTFAHQGIVDGAVTSGTGRSRVEMREGRVALVEDFELDGVAHVSVCIESD